MLAICLASCFVISDPNWFIESNVTHLIRSIQLACINAIISISLWITILTWFRLYSTAKKYAPSMSSKLVKPDFTDSNCYLFACLPWPILVHSSQRLLPIFVITCCISASWRTFTISYRWSNLSSISYHASEICWYWGLVSK